MAALCPAAVMLAAGKLLQPHLVLTQLLVVGLHLRTVAAVLFQIFLEFLLVQLNLRTQGLNFFLPGLLVGLCGGIW